MIKVLGLDAPSKTRSTLDKHCAERDRDCAIREGLKAESTTPKPLCISQPAERRIKQLAHSGSLIQRLKAGELASAVDEQEN